MNNKKLLSNVADHMGLKLNSEYSIVYGTYDNYVLIGRYLDNGMFNLSIGLKKNFSDDVLDKEDFKQLLKENKKILNAQVKKYRLDIQIANAFTD